MVSNTKEKIKLYLVLLDVILILGLISSLAHIIFMINLCQNSLSVMGVQS